MGYQLDTTGNALAFQLFQEEQTRGGDRPFDEEVTITGTAAGSEIAMSSVCITPKANNPSVETFCYNASTKTMPTIAFAMPNGPGCIVALVLTVNTIWSGRVLFATMVVA